MNERGPSFDPEKKIIGYDADSAPVYGTEKPIGHTEDGDPIYEGEQIVGYDADSTPVTKKEAEERESSTTD